MEPWLIALLPLLFILIWCLGLTTLGWLSGWRALARRYRAAVRPEGAHFAWQAGNIGGLGYRDCLTIRVAAEGLYLAMAWPFRAGHPALLLPWADLRVSRVGRTLGFDWAELTVGDPPVARMQLPLRVMEAARQLVPAGEGGGTTFGALLDVPPVPVEWQTQRTRLGVWRRCTGPDGRRFSEFVSHARLFGLPLIHCTYGIHPETGRRVVAKGFFAAGRLAVGVIAVGHASAGVVAIGQAALGLLLGLGQATTGVVAVGQLAVGVLFGFGQVTTGYFAIGQVAVGVEAVGQVPVRL